MVPNVTNSQINDSPKNIHVNTPINRVAPTADAANATENNMMKQSLATSEADFNLSD
jgi:hypothetical protein